MLPFYGISEKWRMPVSSNNYIISDNAESFAQKLGI